MYDTLKEEGVNIITGIHGRADGAIKAAHELFHTDSRNCPWANVYDYIKLSDEEFEALLNTDSNTILAWCYSSASELLELIEKLSS